MNSIKILTKYFTLRAKQIAEKKFKKNDFSATRLNSQSVIFSFSSMAVRAESLGY